MRMASVASVVLLASLVVPMTGCGGGGGAGPPAGPETGRVRITVQLPTTTAEVFPAGSPTISKVEVTITADDMEEMSRTLDWDPDTREASGTLTVPAGHNRTFTVNVYDDADLLVYTGSATSDVEAGETTTVHIVLYRVTGGAEVIAGTGRIAFSTDRDGNDEVYAAFPDGAGLQNLTDDPSADWAPDWSPDSSQIAFVSDRSRGPGTLRIYIMDADGSNVTQLTDVWEWNAAPEWSPDGTRIAFHATPQPDFSGNREIYVVDADGSNVTRLTNTTADIEDGGPSWSPDGSQIAYYSGQANAWQIWTMNVDGSDKTQVTDDGEFSSFPFWSPDGSRLAFKSSHNGNTDVYTCRPDGSDRQRCTTHSAHDTPTAWSPDGAKILFHSDRSGNWDVYMMDADGSNMQPVISNPAKDLGASWSTF